MSEPVVTRLVMIRHGESMATVARRIGGPRTCQGLSELGRLQAGRLRARLERSGELTPTAVFSSAYPRALQTAELTIPAWGAPEISVVPALGEHDPGEICDGMSYNEFTTAYGTVDWENPWAQAFPGGETIAAFHFRVGTALHGIIGANLGGTIAVFCHGGVIDATFRQLLRMPPTGAFQLHTLNTALTEFAWVLPNTWQLTRYNDTAHLEGLPKETPRAGTDEG